MEEEEGAMLVAFPLMRVELPLAEAVGAVELLDEAGAEVAEAEEATELGEVEGAGVA